MRREAAGTRPISPAMSSCGSATGKKGWIPARSALLRNLYPQPKYTCIFHQLFQEVAPRYTGLSENRCLGSYAFATTWCLIIGRSERGDELGTRK